MAENSEYIKLVISVVLDFPDLDSLFDRNAGISWRDITGRQLKGHLFLLNANLLAPCKINRENSDNERTYTEGNADSQGDFAILRHGTCV